MSIVKYDEWIIDLNDDKTKEYYSKLPRCEDERYQKFFDVCNNLSRKEYDFFNSFCIKPNLGQIKAIFTDDKEILCAGYYFVFGNFLHYPEQDTITAEELQRRNFIYDFRDIKIYVGRFSFDIQCPHHLLHSIPKEMPKGCICIDFMCNVG